MLRVIEFKHTNTHTGCIILELVLDTQHETINPLLLSPDQFSQQCRADSKTHTDITYV